MENTYFPRIIHRVRAALVDSLLFVIVPLAAVVAGDAAGLDALSAKLLLACLALFVLEPVPVAWTGGTLGHHLFGLRVRRRDGAGNIGLPAAGLRFVVKTLLGWLSFVFILTSAKHQAIHDIAAGSVVVWRDTKGLPAYELQPERRPDDGFVYPPAWRRVLVGVVYFVVMNILFVGITNPVISVQCASFGRCGTVDFVVEAFFSLLWLLASGWIVVNAWRGRLPGSRRRAVATAVD